MSDIQSLIQSINEFRDERNWRKYHNPKDLAISISIEAAELLEDFQWISSEEALIENKENIREEIADVLIYSLMLCSDLGLDVKKIVEEKILKNGMKYPVGDR
ncbi:nucleotide pyrophosphohydrolase [Bacillus sp. ISL-47]|uniref:nucleotide pyrophosphohydrolase n=1 Tax=Bacillus sp. ISL-47 TaxID=2819130 RepID=UPI001BE71973|nr:nucleotide pyrophosphohydrolase [Bacillus sp. ISL-47]MBT2690974.1 nucleotide pyrophosphohydrolase [Bacillus sp. ISL-47]MBT2706752.1 nucleotide pyrophosphohydrolase [Pseudomonas sp. ISL-84]